MRQVRFNSPVSQASSQRASVRRASIVLGLVAAGLTLLTAVTGYAQAQNTGAAHGGRGSSLPPVNYPIDEFGSGQAPAAVPMTPAQPPVSKSDKACCTPGKDCPCTAGKDCACTPGVNCPCTPGKDCACTPGVNCPARPPLRADFCTPGKNCPCSGDNCRYCTPGKDCPCTPFINCPEDRGVIFDKNSGQLSEENRQKLTRAVEELKKLPEGERIRIEGHTTPAEGGGVPPARLKLSQERARSVEQALLGAGLPPTRIAATLGWGGLCPQVIAVEDEKNRRVQFMFSSDQTLCAHPESARRPAKLPPPFKRPAKPGVKPNPATQVKPNPATQAKPNPAAQVKPNPATQAKPAGKP
jgi:hypothetical protein